MATIADIVDYSREIASPFGLELADRQMQGEIRAVFTPAVNLPANADDFFLARPEIVFNVAVMLAAVGLGHEHLDILPNKLGCAISEQAFSCRVNTLDQTALVDRDDRGDR